MKVSSCTLIQHSFKFEPKIIIIVIDQYGSQSGRAHYNNYYGNSTVHARSQGGSTGSIEPPPPASQGGSTGSIHHIPYIIHTPYTIHRTPQLDIEPPLASEGGGGFDWIDIYGTSNPPASQGGSVSPPEIGPGKPL